MKKIWIFFFTVFAISQAMCDPLSWASPVTLSAASVDASDPQIVIDSNGNATAAWVENGVVKTSSQPVGGSWGTAGTLSGSGASNPRLTVDGSGNVTAVWIESTGVVTSADFLFGSSWGSSNAVSDVGASNLEFAVDSATGDVVAVWKRSGFIESATKLFGNPWGVVSILSNGDEVDSPQIAVNGGMVAVVWHDRFENLDLIAAITSVVGGSWNQVQLMATSLNSVKPMIAVDSNGTALAIWYQFTLTGLNYSNVAVVASSLPAGNTNWSPPVVISSLGKHNPADLTARVAFDAAGNAIAIWSNVYNEDLFAIESAILPLAGNWGTVVQLDANDLYGYTADVAVNSYGDAVAVYMSFNGESSIVIWNTESNINGVTSNFWSVPVLISEGTQNAFPRVASALTGTTVNAVSVWINNDGTNNLIHAATGSKTILLPPSSPNIVQNVHDFGVFKEYYNTVSWTASSDPNTIAYRIYKNGVAYTIVGASLTELVDDNVVQNGPVTYGIASVDSTNSISTVVSVSFP